MKKIAIISYYHTESSLCLAKYLADEGVAVDYYFIRFVTDKSDAVPGIEYYGASKRFGICKLTVNEIREMIEYANSAPVTYHVINTLGESRRYRWLSRIIMWFSMFFIKRKRYDAINVVGQVRPVLQIHRLLRRENLIHTIHEIGSHQFNKPTTPLINEIIHDKSKVILHSESTFKRFKLINGADQVLTTIIPFGKFETNLLYEKDIDLNYSIPSDKFVFLFFGYMRPYKGLDVLAASVQELRKMGKEFFVIVAGGGEDPNLDYFAREENCLVINRHLSNSEMMKLNRIASVILMPYHSASQTGIAPTAFMFGNPIIATKVGALPEVIVDGENGLLVEKDDPSAFAHAMKKLIDNEALLNHLQNGALLFGIGDKWDWNLIAKKTIDFYFSE